MLWKRFADSRGKALHLGKWPTPLESSKLTYASESEDVSSLTSLTIKIRNLRRPGGTLQSVVHLVSGNVTAGLITMVASILVARWTDPRDMGIWNAALLVSIYSPTLQLGVINGLNRELPYLIGSDNYDRAIRMAEAAYAWVWLLVVLSITCGAAAAVWFWVVHKPTLALTSLAISIVVLSSWPILYFTATYRTHADFGRLARNTVISATAGVGLALLVWRFHFHGLLLRAALVAVLGAVVLSWKRPMRVKPRWGTSQLIHLARIGLPIWFVGQLGAFFMSFDRLVLVRSTEVLGYFTIAIQAGTFARIVPVAFATVMYPKMAKHYGETHCAMDLWKLARRAAFAAAATGLAVGICGWLILPPFVHFILPRYSPGISAARCSAFLGFAMGFYQFDNIYNVIRRQDLYIMNWCVACASFAASWFILTRWLAVPMALAAAASMLIATFTMAMTSMLVSRRACLLHDHRRRLAGEAESATPIETL